MLTLTKDWLGMAEQRIKTLLAKIVDDFHVIFTPFGLVLKIVNNLINVGAFNGGQSKTLIIANLEFLYVIVRLYKLQGWSLKNVYFAAKSDVKLHEARHIIAAENVYKYDYKELVECFRCMPKFDVVVANPPYLQNLHLDFLVEASKLLNPTGYGIFIHPGSWLLNEVPASKKVINTIKAMDQLITHIEFKPGNETFKDADLGIPLSITQFKAIKRDTNIIVIDNLRKTTYTVPTISEITKHADNPVYRSLKAKILDYIEKNGSVRDHLKDEIDGAYVVFAYLRGNVKKNGDPCANFYTFFSKVQQTITTEKPGSDKKFARFSSKEEAQNFDAFLRTFFARFCLSIAKFDRTITPATLQTTPWMDFSKRWSDEDLMKTFELTQEEKDLITATIEPYFSDEQQPQ